jgi:hypothetical protein
MLIGSTRFSVTTSSYDAKERLQGYGPVQKMMYNMMETHFKQRAAQPPPIAPEQLIAPEQDEAGARAGSARARAGSARAVAPEQDEAGACAGSARAAGKAPASASAGATRQLKRPFVDDYDMSSVGFDPAANDAASSAPRKTKTKVREAEFEEIFSISKLGDPTYARKRKTFYEENGILCIDLENKINKHKAVREFVTCLFRQMPYSDEFLLNFKLANGKELHINNDEDVDAIVDVLLEKKINQENLNRLKKCLPPHASFGAPCTLPLFHLNIENEIRQDPELYRAIAFLLNNECINCDLNRAIFRVPTVTEGEDFLHFDLDPREIRPSADSELQGKVCVTECRFICVPGSNTDGFLKTFVEAYDPLYPRRKLGLAKYSLRPDKDPWDLFGKQRAFRVPAGHAVFWSPKILHGHPSFARETPISIGFYLGFHPEVSAEEQEIRRKLFSTGGVPDKWPSGDRIWFFPKMFQTFPNVLQKTVIDRLTPSAYAALVKTRVTKSGKEVPDMKPWGWAGTFEPFVFTDLGEYITGQRKWGAKTKAQAH